MDDFLRVLAANQIAFLIDVRSAPYSRFKPEFSKDSLEARLIENGIRYLFLGDKLGGQPDDPACYVDGKVIYERVAARPAFWEGLARLQRAAGRDLRIVLMCSEGKPEQCHRSKLIGQQLEQLGSTVLHIDEKDEIVGQRDIELELTDGQMSLFPEQFTSRKRYRKEGPGDAD